jgi:hypothetical protein
MTDPRMTDQPTSTYSTYGQQAPMPPAMQPGYQVHQRHTTRLTRPGWATTELIAYVVTVLGVLIASAVVGDGDGPGRDYFGADQAWALITILTFGYMLSKGIAKAGKGGSQYDENTRFDSSPRY